MVNIDPEVSGIMLRVRASYACSNVLGQICLDAVVNPPKPGDPSYELFNKVYHIIMIKKLSNQIFNFFLFGLKEKHQILSSLKERAKLVTELLNKIEGVHCNPVQGILNLFNFLTFKACFYDHFQIKGALYAFPRVTIPQRAVDHALVLDKLTNNYSYYVKLMPKV